VLPRLGHPTLERAKVPKLDLLGLPRTDAMLAGNAEVPEILAGRGMRYGWSSVVDSVHAHGMRCGTELLAEKVTAHVFPERAELRAIKDGNAEQRLLEIRQASDSA
jgi:hypothetical protein